MRLQSRSTCVYSELGEEGSGGTGKVRHNRPGKKTKNCRGRGFGPRRELIMRFMRKGRSGLVLGFLTLAAVGCGGGGHARSHATQTRTPAPVPTPDTTPIQALRTPAGLILKAGPESSATHPPTTPPVT